MAFANCPICGKLFDKQGFYQVCPSCFAKTEADFDKVRNYLYDNPDKNILEVASDTGVSLAVIREFIRQGRLASL